MSTAAPPRRLQSHSRRGVGGGAAVGAAAGPEENRTARETHDNVNTRLFAAFDFTVGGVARTAAFTVDVSQSEDRT